MPSQICSDVEIKGSIVFKEKLVFDGTLNGGSIQGTALIVGENATIQGDIRASFLTVQGSVKGNAYVTEKTVLGETASLHGDLATARLTMNEGASFFGSSKIGPLAMKAAAVENPEKMGTPSGDQASGPRASAA